MILAPPIVVSLDYTPATAWTSYVTPRATWAVDAMPVTVGFSGSVPGVAVDPVSLLQVSMNPWTGVDCTLLRMKAVASTTALGAEVEDGKNDVLVHTTEWPSTFTVGAVGQTVLYLRGAFVVEADIHLNARDYAFVLGDVPGKIDVQSVLTHELGHVLGIGHTDVARATMNAGLVSGIAARSLERDDLDAVCALYPGAGPSLCTTLGCPTGWSCVGRTCQRAGEPGVAGGACATAGRPCEGAGDAAECIATSAGPLCAIPCSREAATFCGGGMRCVDVLDGSYCLPESATPIVDAGPPPDAGTDAGPAATGGDNAGCSCELRPPRRDFGAWASLLILAWALRQSRTKSTA